MENSELVDVDERAYGAFFGGDSYVIKYTYTKNNKPSHIIYFWQVRARVCVYLCEYSSSFYCTQYISSAKMIDERFSVL